MHYNFNIFDYFIQTREYKQKVIHHIIFFIFLIDNTCKLKVFQKKNTSNQLEKMAFTYPMAETK